LVLVLCLAAPTAGDIGGCGKAVEELDATKFFTEKRFVDCNKCLACSIASAACQRACSDEPVESSFPEGCFPLAHDGEVCLNALRDADCDEYLRYVDDVAPEAPTECNFCPPDGRPGGP
jgi:hypothetical protein